MLNYSTFISGAAVAHWVKGRPTDLMVLGSTGMINRLPNFGVGQVKNYRQHAHGQVYFMASLVQS